MLCILKSSSLSSLQLFWDGFVPALGSCTAGTATPSLSILSLFGRYSVHIASTVRQTLATVTNVVIDKVGADRGSGRPVPSVQCHVSFVNASGLLCVLAHVHAR